MSTNHSHAHPEGRAANGYAARPHPEPVVLDIGAPYGALIVHSAPELHGVEVEISPAGDDATRQHKQVLERRMNDRPAFTVVFDRIPEGRYSLWIDDEPRAREVAVAAGEITELDWRI